MGTKLPDDDSGGAAGAGISERPLRLLLGGLSSQALHLLISEVGGLPPTPTPAGIPGQFQEKGKPLPRVQCTVGTELFKIMFYFPNTVDIQYYTTYSWVYSTVMRQLYSSQSDAVCSS